MTPERIEEIKRFADSDWQGKGIGEAINIIDECLEEIDRLKAQLKSARRSIEYIADMDTFTFSKQVQIFAHG